MKEGTYSYHQWSVRDVGRHFDVNLKEGLSAEEALFRLKKNGLNKINKKKTTTWFTILLRQFANFFVGLLILAAIISYCLDGIGGALVLLGIVVINVFMGFYQEFKAQRALENLEKNFQQQCKVFRNNGNVEEIDSKNLVLGDIVLIGEGDKVPADIRIVSEESLRVNESMLTGESLPASKHIKPLQIDTPLADRRNMLYAGTTIVAGHGTGLVVAVADNTEIGKIAGNLAKKEDKTPLEKQINYIGRNTTLFALAVVIIIFILGTFKKVDSLYLLTLTIALFVAAVPESLPTAITLALSVGAGRMAQKNAIVRRMVAIETLGKVQIIATDKTGTITNNHLSIEKISFFKDKKIEDQIFLKNSSVQTAAFLFKALACSSIKLNKEKKIVGDPVEVAIAEGARKMFNHEYVSPPKYKKLFEEPFSSDKKYMSVLVENDIGEVLIAKGMPEKIISFCSIDVETKKKLLLKAAQLSAEGYKVLGLAEKKITGKNTGILSGMTLLGFISLADEPAKGVEEAIMMADNLGLRSVILTGDHLETARFVAQKIGLKVADNEVITGQDLRNLSQPKLLSVVKKTKIFARVSPEDKLDIVKAFKKAGYQVAVAGDGVNDAPALIEANAGIAMGKTGTDVAKDSADIVLLDNKYGTIVSAIEYGRTIYDNIKNVVIHLLAGNFSEILLVALIFLIGFPSPLTTLQILWVNLITDSLPAIALGLERPSAQVIDSSPRPAASNSLRPAIIYSIKLSLVTLTICLFIYLWGLHHSVAKAQTMTFSFFVAVELIYCLSIRAKKRIWQQPMAFFANKYLLLAIVFSLMLQLVIFLPPFKEIFGLISLSLGEIGFLVIMVFVAFLIAEFIRAYEDRKNRPR